MRIMVMIIMIIVIITILSRHHNHHLVISPRPPQEKVKVLNGLIMTKCQNFTIFVASLFSKDIKQVKNPRHCEVHKKAIIITIVLSLAIIINITIILRT